MQFGGSTFVLAIIGMSFLAWIITTWIRARHGYPIENEWGGTCNIGDGSEKAAKALVAENEQLKATIGKLEERMKVLERIATDPSRQLAEDIEKLR